MTIDSSEPEKKEISLRTVIAACTTDNKQVARMWLYYTLFYWMLPTLIVMFGFLVAKRSVNVIDLVIHGEFLIYSITLVASSTRLIVKDIPGSDPFVNRQGFNLAAHVMIFPAIFTYGLVRYIGLTASPDAVSKPIVVGYSVLLLIASFGFSFLVFLIDAQRSSNTTARQAAESIRHAPDKLIHDFDEIQGPPPEATPQPEAATVPASTEVEIVEVAEVEAKLETDFNKLEGGQ
jgi:hypothetical protein